MWPPKACCQARDLARLLKTHVYPAWRDRPFLQIRKSDVAQLLDTIEDNRGARQADMILAIVRSVMNWRAARSDDYSAPIVKGMQRTAPRSAPAPARSTMTSFVPCGRRLRATMPSDRSSACFC